MTARNHPRPVPAPQLRRRSPNDLRVSPARTENVGRHAPVDRGPITSSGYAEGLGWSSTSRTSQPVAPGSVADCSRSRSAAAQRDQHGQPLPPSGRKNVCRMPIGLRERRGPLPWVAGRRSTHGSLPLRHGGLRGSPRRPTWPPRPRQRLPRVHTAGLGRVEVWTLSRSWQSLRRSPPRSRVWAWTR